MKISTKTGDQGSTGLMGGKRLPKSDVRFHAIGTIDELSACLGAVIAGESLHDPLKDQLTWIQHLLFLIGADLATPLGNKGSVNRIDATSAMKLEEWSDAMETNLPPLQNFILPGGSPSGARLHMARTICRRAERWIVALSEREQLTSAMLPTINRLSDYLFVAARYVNMKNDIVEIEAKMKK